MAQRDQLDRETLSCSICLDLLKDPVTTTCGHSYCMSCIKGFWDGEDQRKLYSCPQCREAFTPRPVLKKNTMLAALVEQLKKTGLQTAPADHCYAGPEDVACDVCTGRKLKAFKSCLVCLASYCENHLQSHYESPTFKKHKLVEPSKKLQENICSRHDEVMKIFCRTDKKSICYLCTMDDHKGHDTVPAAAERTERQRELEVSRLNIQQRIQDREKDVKLLQQEVEAVSRSADKAVEDSEKIFTQLIRLLQKRSSDVKQQIRSQQETEVSGVKELQEKLQQEITELKRKDAELKQLSHTEDHNQFLHNYPSVSQLSEPTDSSSINIRPLRYFEDVTAAVSELRDKLQDILRDEWTNISLAVTEVDVLLPQPPKTRAEFLKYSCEITLDPTHSVYRLQCPDVIGLAVSPEMAQRDELDRESFSCVICLDLLKDPVTTTCGHSYCMSCIKGFWDGEDQRKIYSCPQCREAFTPRPVLKKNTMLAALVEQLKKTGLQAAPADHCYAGPEDVACDVCTGRKLKAFKSCLVCLASYCENHLQSHYESPTFKKHKLVEPSKKLQENICSRHDEVMKIFCRTDKKSICYLCTMDEHKGHDTVPAAAERTERQRELEVSRLNIQQRIQDREKDVKLLQQEVEAVSHSADKAVEDSEKIFIQLIRLLQERSSDVKQQIRSQQETEVSGVKELLEKLQQEITGLKRKDAELKQLSHTEDHNQFLHNYPSVSQLSEPTDSSSINIRPLRYFEDVTAAVSELRDKLQDILRDEWTNISLTVTEPKTRAGFLKYSREITLDPNAANTKLLLSEGNRKVQRTGQHQSYSSHTDRFTDYPQVLSRESLTGRCYWEVEWGGKVYVAVAYKNISRAGNESMFGRNDKSWSLTCYPNSYQFYFNNIHTLVSGPRSSRVGVYLDHRAGILSFYSVSETMTLLHRVQTTFTQPLYAGLYVGVGSTAELCKVK
ncbi:E3 ubiquitin/ISG15 ligase TRIM25-like [Scomber japonicus]|uniref:E3 ubiquitin/ISG15 ligase TRIM25-like n=1 Tax=Scomber japonicus TaxID=13676 RepID=UPI0023057886|nr:E3 ubiquitin/ISG15 ligase TRIM25-like [Scomber japonicus]